MRYFRLWAHEQVSKLDHPHVNRHFPVVAVALLLALVLSAPAYRFALGETGPTLTIISAQDSGAQTAHLQARMINEKLSKLTFHLTSTKGNTIDINGEGGPQDWSVETTLEPDTYLVEASGFDFAGIQFFTEQPLELVMKSSSNGGTEPPILTFTTFQPETANGNLFILKAQSNQPLVNVTFNVTGKKGFNNIFASDHLGNRLAWQGFTSNLPFGDTYTAIASGVDEANTAVTSGPLVFVLAEENSSGESPAETTLDMKDARISSSSVPNRVVMEAVANGPQPVTVQFKVTGPNFNKAFPASFDDTSGVWRTLRDLPFDAQYTIFAEANLENGSIIGSQTSRDIIIAAEEVPAEDPVNEPTNEPPVDEPVNDEPVTEHHAEILSPRSGDTFSGPVQFVVKLSAQDALSTTFFVKDTVTGTPHEFSASQGRTPENWVVFFESAPSSFEVKSRSRFADGSFFTSSAIPFTIAVPESDSTDTKTDTSTNEEPLPPPPDEDLLPPLKEDPLIDETLTENKEPLPPSDEISEEELLKLEQERLEEERRRRLLEEEKLGAVAESTDTTLQSDAPLFEEERPRFMELSEEEKQQLEEERLRELREREKINLALPMLATNTEDQKDALLHMTFMDSEGDKLDALADECRENTISRDNCASWLKARYQAKTCFVSGAITKEACSVHIRETENREPEERELLGIASHEELENFRETTQPLFNTSFSAEDLSEEVQAVMTSVPRGNAKVRMFEAVSTGDTVGVASPGIWTFDTDGDGLSDDAEERYGTDPLNSDTDADGFLDGEEVRGGFNPLGEGRLEKRASGIEKAMLEGVAIEEPRLSDKIDRSIKVAEAKSIEPLDETSNEVPVFRLTGIAAPNSLISLFIYTYLPVVVTTTTDADGNWNYDFSSKLAEGSHEAYVSVNDDTGKVIARSEPLSFFVRTAQAVTEEDFLAGDVNVIEPVETYTRYFIGGGIALILLALGAVALIAGRVGKQHTSLESIE